MSSPDDRFEELVDDIVDSVPVNEDSLRGFDSPEQRELAEAFRELSDISEAFQLVAETFPTATDGGPEEWGELVIQELIGSGSTADVFRAYDPRLERVVALKLFRDDAATDTAALREGRLLATIRHENVATIYGADVREGRAGIWMELFDGPTLRDYIRSRGPFPMEECVRVGRAICRALSRQRAI